MKSIIGVILIGAATAQLGLAFAPAVFITYLGTAIVVSMMILSGLIAARINRLKSS